MGNKYEVLAWLDLDRTNEFKQHSMWRGESFFKALYQMYHVYVNTNAGCVTLVWRPEPRKM